MNDKAHSTTFNITPVFSGYNRQGDPKYDFAILRDVRDLFPIVMIHTDVFLPTRDQRINEKGDDTIHRLLQSGCTIDVVASFHLTRETQDLLKESGK
jgi:hypothetical protein